MKHNEQKFKCSKCSSLQNEYFKNEIYHGIRCLICGHEKKKKHELPYYELETVFTGFNKN